MGDPDVLEMVHQGGSRLLRGAGTPGGRWRPRRLDPRDSWMRCAGARQRRPGARSLPGWESMDG